MGQAVWHAPRRAGLESVAVHGELAGAPLGREFRLALVARR